MNDDKSFTQNIQHVLDHSSEELDADVARRLRLARHQALEAYQEKQNYWKPAAGFAVATMLLVAIGVWQFAGKQQDIEKLDQSETIIATNIEDLELIASSESMQFYQDLEFYQWLDTLEGNAG